MDSRRLLDVLVGIYVSMLVVTASALLRWETVAPGFSVGSAIIVGLAIAAVVALVAGTVDELAEKAASRTFDISLLGFCLGYVVYLVAVAERGSLQALVAGTGVVATVPGIGINVLGNRITNRRLREASTEIVGVTVGAYEETPLGRWLQFGTPIVAIGVITVSVGLLSLFERPAVSTSLTVGLALVTLFNYVVVDDSAEISVTDMGVAVDQYIGGSHSRSFNRWDELDGYRLTDDTVELVHSRLFVSTMDFDREAISDEDVLLDGLAEFLPRLGEEGKPVDRGGRSTLQREYT